MVRRSRLPTAAASYCAASRTCLWAKDPRDAAHITQRVCGVCPVPHTMVSCLALEAIAGLNVCDNARHCRNLILGVDYTHSRILHFYTLVLPSYIKTPAMRPATPAPWRVCPRHPRPSLSRC